MIGVTLISISEMIGTEIIIRYIHKVMHYGNKKLKKVIPIMLTLLGIVKLDIKVTDMLYKMAHNEDKEIALRSLFGLGVIAAGTNNSKIS